MPARIRRFYRDRLRRADILARLYHEQRRPPFADERLYLLKVTSETAFDLAGRTIAERQPDDLRRSTEQGGTTAEVPVLRHYGEAMLPCLGPNGRVVRRRQPDRSNVNNFAPDVAKAVAEPR